MLDCIYSHPEVQTDGWTHLNPRWQSEEVKAVIAQAAKPWLGKTLPSGSHSLCRCNNCSTHKPSSISTPERVVTAQWGHTHLPTWLCCSSKSTILVSIVPVNRGCYRTSSCVCTCMLVRYQSLVSFPWSCPSFFSSFFFLLLNTHLVCPSFFLPVLPSDRVSFPQGLLSRVASNPMVMLISSYPDWLFNVGSGDQLGLHTYTAGTSLSKLTMSPALDSLFEDSSLHSEHA